LATPPESQAEFLVQVFGAGEENILTLINKLFTRVPKLGKAVPFWSFPAGLLALRHKTDSADGTDFVHLCSLETAK
jgi:hypothetical protein